MLKTRCINDLKYLLDDKKAFIFDFDGTIADTEKYHWKAYDVCLSKFKISLSNENIVSFIGNKEKDIYLMIKNEFNIEFDDNDFRKRRKDIFYKLIETHNLEPFKFFIELCSNYSNKEWYILSSQEKQTLMYLLKKWNLETYFKKIIPLANSRNSKFSIIENTFTFLNVNNNEIALFEDSNDVLAFAKLKGIAAIGVQHEFNINILKDCDAIIGDKI